MSRDSCRTRSRTRVTGTPCTYSACRTEGSHGRSPDAITKSRGFHFHQWAWVDLNYRPHAYQIRAGRWRPLESGGFHRFCAGGRWPALLQVLSQLSRHPERTRPPPDPGPGDCAIAGTGVGPGVEPHAGLLAPRPPSSSSSQSSSWQSLRATHPHPQVPPLVRGGVNG